MSRFVNENMTTAEQVDYAWTHRDLFERCRAHNHKVALARLYSNEGRYISGWDIDAEQTGCDPIPRAVTDPVVKGSKGAAMGSKGVENYFDPLG